MRLKDFSNKLSSYGLNPSSNNKKIRLFNRTPNHSSFQRNAVRINYHSLLNHTEFKDCYSIGYVAEWELMALQLAVTLNLDPWASPGEVPEHDEQEF